MAKRPAAKKAAAAAPTTKAPTYRNAMRALEAAGANKHEIGRMRADGTTAIDSEQLEALKKKLGKAAWSKVRFVALNAPFKRQSATPQV